MDPVLNSLLTTLTVLIEALQFGHGSGGGGAGSGAGKNGSNGAAFKSKFGVDESTYASYTQDVVSYVISTGVIDKLNLLLFNETLERANFSGAGGGGGGGEEGGNVDADVGEVVTRILGFLTALTQLLMLRMDKEKKHEGWLGFVISM